MHVLVSEKGSDTARHQGSWEANFFPNGLFNFTKTLRFYFRLFAGSNVSGELSSKCHGAE